MSQTGGGQNPMVVEEACLAACDGQAARTHAATSRKKHHTYRKVLNLRPMRDGGTMSASKFTSRIHH
jgi:hypothetical protein